MSQQAKLHAVENDGIGMNFVLRSISEELNMIAARTEKLHDLVFNAEPSSLDVHSSRHVQAIDENVQILNDLSALVREMAASHPDSDLGSPETALAALNLDTLRARLTRQQTQSDDAPGSDGDCDFF